MSVAHGTEQSPVRPAAAGSEPPAVLEVARDLVFLLALAAYIVVIGQNWAVYAAAAMVAAYRQAFRFGTGAHPGRALAGGPRGAPAGD